MLAKAPSLSVDMAFVDLEDSVAPSEKEAARPKAVAAVRDQDWGDKVVCVRLNAWDSAWTAFDVIEVVGATGERLDEVMLPKVQSPAEVVALDLLLTQVEAKAGLPPGHVGIEAQIETAAGLLQAAAICAASPRLEAVILGPIDMSASLELPESIDGGAIPEAVRVGVLVAGRAAGLQVIDGPYSVIRDLEGCRRHFERSRRLGYDGAWVLHPDQVALANDVYSPDQAGFDRACTVLEAYEAATTGDRRGAVMLGDEMIDEASRKVALKMVARGERAGLKRTGSST